MKASVGAVSIALALIAPTEPGGQLIGVIDAHQFLSVVIRIN